MSKFLVSHSKKDANKIALTRLRNWIKVKMNTYLDHTGEQVRVVARAQELQGQRGATLYTTKTFGDHDCYDDFIQVATANGINITPVNEQ